MQSNVVRLALRGARKARPRHNMVRYLREHELLDVVLVPLRALVELEDRVERLVERVERHVGEARRERRAASADERRAALLPTAAVRLGVLAAHLFRVVKEGRHTARLRYIVNHRHARPRGRCVRLAVVLSPAPARRRRVRPRATIMGSIRRPHTALRPQRGRH